CGAETVSGTFYCLVARGTQIIRHYYHCHSSLAVPYSFGETLPSEKNASFDDLYGAGFWALLNDLGFDYERSTPEAPKPSVTWTADWVVKKEPFPGPGPLGPATKKHGETHSLEPADRPSIKIRMTDPRTGQVTELDTGVQLDGTRKRKKPWWRFW